jgi:hypothetical protein
MPMMKTTKSPSIVAVYRPLCTLAMICPLPLGPAAEQMDS